MLKIIILVLVLLWRTKIQAEDIYERTEASTEPEYGVTSHSKGNGASAPTSSSTTDTCDYNGDSAYFTCSSKGRYRNPQDPSCETYYLCNLLRNGSFVQTIYKCPLTSFFNPPRQVCDVNYKCDCHINTSTTILTTTTEGPITETETEDFLTTETATPDRNSDESSASTSTTLTTTVTCDYNEDSAYFSCSSKGRYRNPQDPSCETYYLCNLLRNGSFVQTLYKCPLTSFFNPPRQVCDVNYKCPCDINTSTTILTTTTEESMTETETEEISTTGTATTEGVSDEASASTPTSASTTETCDYIEDPAYFTCGNTGRYRNLNDPSCKTYYLCNLLRNGSFLQTLYRCPSTSFFNPLQQVCDLTYKCPCEMNTSTTVLTTTTEEPVTETEPEEISTTETATTEGVSDEASASTPTSASTTETCDYIEDPAYFTCGSTGRYRNLNDPSCETYYLCNLLRNGSFLQTLYRCPSTSFFNPLQQVCDLTYECPCEMNTSTTFLTTTTEEQMTETEQEDISTTETATTEGVSDEASASTPTSASTTETCDNIEDPAYFTCGSTGRYRNLNDPSCETYYLCNLLRNGSFLQTLYRCPSTSFFNPAQQVCDLTYKCPCEINTSTTIPTTTTEEPMTETEPEEISTTETATTEGVSDEASASTPTSASTTETCDYIEDPAYFTCGNTGRYRNLNDPSCETYYLCNLLRNGSLLQTLYRCPSTSFFNPLQQVCDLTYDCPCEMNTSTTILTTTTEEPMTETEPEEISTTETETTEGVSDEASASTPTSASTSETCDYIEDPAYFTCGSTGRYRNLNDPSCETYYLCNLLRNGSFLQTLYRCPSTSFFNPAQQVCDLTYKCPCEINTSTTIPTTTTEEPMTETEPEEISTTETATTEGVSDEASASTQTSASTTETCDYIKDPAYFTCGNTGRYRNLNDPFCETYYLCNLLRNGSFLQTLYRCPSTSFFNPLQQVCDLTYKCPCEMNTTTTVSTTTTEEPMTETEPEEISTTETATTEGVSDEASASTPTSASTTETCDYIEDPAYFTCGSTGRYRNLNDPFCETYYLCNLLRNGSFLQTLYRCPSTSFFNPLQQVCDLTYKCPCEINTSTTIPTTTTEEPMTETEPEEISTTETATTEGVSDEASGSTPTSASTTETCDYIEDPAYFTCGSTGRYRNLNDPSCETYYLCNLLRNGSFLQTLYRCPSTSFFNPLQQVCDLTYKCPCEMNTSTTVLTTTTEEPMTESEPEEISTTETATTEGVSDEASASTPTSASTTETCDYIEDPAYFTCGSTGRYRNLNDPSCETYYLCNLLRNGSFLQTLYRCPSTSFFNPAQQVCDLTYKCTCEINTSTTVLTTTTEEPMTETEPEEISTTETATTEGVSDEASASSPTSASTTETCDFIEDPAYFTYGRTGRYRNLNDPSCETYYLCNLLRNGSFLQTLYRCPSTSFFNPLQQVCDLTYKCPCEMNSSTTVLTTTTEEPMTETEPEEISTTETATTEGVSDEASASTPSSASTTETCDYIEDPAYFTCGSTGRYRNLNDPSCETYYLCNLLRNGSFLQTLYRCPSTSFFNPAQQVCDLTYKCSCEINTSTTIPTTTTEEPMTETEPEEISTTETAMTEGVSDGASASTPTSASTTETCDYIDDPAYFTCGNTGRYRNLNDPSCETYYLCNLLRNGSFLQTLYRCPSTSFFNPLQQVCDLTYKCPCEMNTSTTIPTTTTEEPMTETEPEEISTTKTATTEGVSDEASTFTPSSASTTETCDYIEDPAYFTCGNTGRYRNLNDPSCETYYLCNLLRNGYFLQTLYRCPSTSFFNPLQQVCDLTYKCPCEMNTSTTVLITTTEEPMTETEPEEISTTETATTEGVSDEASASTPTSASTTETCDYIEDPAYFTCGNTGRYRNLNDPSCETYYLCNLLRNGSFLQTVYRCPSTSFFNPPQQVCDLTYKCPCEMNTSTTVLITTTEEPMTETEPEEISTTETATTEGVSDEASASTPTSASTTETCDYIEDPAYFTCGNTGRYRNLNDPSCETYYLCNLLRNGSFLQTLYRCPSTSFFNPLQQVCDLTYKCPCEMNTSTTVLTTTTEEPMTEIEPEEISTTETATTEGVSDEASASTPTSASTTETCDYIEDPAYFTCGSTGRYRNLNDPSCETYYLCNLLRNGSFLQTLYRCPSTSFFNPAQQVCDLTYKCPCEINTSTTIPTTTTEEPMTETEPEEISTTETATTEGVSDEAIASTPTSASTTETCDYIDDPAYFTCGNTGRYQNLNDPSCETYYLCNLLRNGSFLQTLYRCPSTSFFNPLQQVCDLTYECPCEMNTSTTILTTTTEEPMTETEPEEISTTETATTEGVSDEASASTTTSASTTETCDYIEDPAYFTCGSTGIYRNLNDPSCESYYLCNLLRNGSFLQTLYRCPSTSFFNPAQQVCDLTYKCPCEINTSTTIPTTTTEEPMTETEPEEISTTETATTEGVSDEASASTPSSASTTETCDYIEDPAYFTCGNTGRYRNLNDPSCETYYLCNLLRNGSFLQTVYRCPSTSFFNPLQQVCDLTYKCPCEMNTTTTVLTTTTEEPMTETELEEISTTDTATTEVVSDEASASTPTSASTTETCDYIEDPAYFTCGNTGRYRNLNDPSCETYYLCNLLRNGSFLQKLYRCPSTSFFNPFQQVCDFTYKCPCEVNTSTTVLITTTEEPMTETEPKEISTTETATTEGVSDEASASTPTSASTTETCDYIDDPAYFTCGNTGRYRNLNDPSCETYYLCNLLRKGSFLQTLYRCPSTSFFNPLQQVCDLTYKCPCEMNTTTTVSTTTTEEPMTETEPEEISTTETATTEGVSDEASASTPTSASTTETCDYIEDPAYFTCGSTGRYRNSNDPSCETYYLCNLLRNGSFLQTLYRCPSTSFFNPVQQVCGLTYKCPCEINTSTTIPTTTTEEPMTETEPEEISTTETATTEGVSDEASASTPSSASTTETCDYIEEPAYFTCGNTERYRNLNDPSCETYYLCNLLRNGSFLQTLYRCPSTSFFNPVQQVCDLTYKCPCEINTSTTIPTTTTEEPMTETEPEEISTTETATTEGVSDEASASTPSSTSTTETCDYIEDPAYFTCGNTGRYRNLNDPSCETYYLCNLLRNGSFLQTLYRCPSTSFFNPLQQVCDLTYKCPCEMNTSTTVLTTTTEEPMTETEPEEISITKTATTEGVSDEASASTPTSASTTETCDYIEDPAYFTCGSTGRYRNLNDPSCETYYLCNLLRNGSFLQTLYRCPSTSFFNPLQQVCDLTYKCPCEINTSTTIPTTTTEEPMTETDPEEISTTETATTESFSDEASASTPTSASTTETCDYIEDPAYFTCGSTGRYRNSNDPSCETYYLCNLLRNGSFLQTLYRCPSTSFFNPLQQVCDLTYKCPCEMNTSTTVLITTTEEPMTETEPEEISTTETATTEGVSDEASASTPTSASTTETCDYIEDPAYFTCGNTGRYRNLNDPSCETYYLCNLLRNGSFLQTLYRCPSTSFFNPLQQVCDLTYKCPCEINTSTTIPTSTTEKPMTETEPEEISTTETATTEGISDEASASSSTSASTTETCDYNDDPAYFTCSSTGRYRNLNDPFCETYYLCNQLRNGSFVQTLYACPSASFFNPPMQVCDVNYKCPCLVNTNTTPLITTTEKLITETETEDFSAPETERDSDASNSTSSSNTEACDYIDYSASFTCDGTGRYRNVNDPTCQTYHLCNPQSDGSFVQSLYICPSTTFFNPQEQVCDDNYKCPCLISTSTIVQTTTTEESITETETDEFSITGNETTERDSDESDLQQEYSIS